MLIASPWILLGSAKRQNTVQSNANATTGHVKSVIHDKYNNCSRFCSVADFFQNGSAWTLEWVGILLAIHPAKSRSGFAHLSTRLKAPWHVNQQTIFLLLISFYPLLLYPISLKFLIISHDVSERIDVVLMLQMPLHLKIVKFQTP
jgi:hypothetical protein